MPSIYVCPLSQIEDMVRKTGARSLLTLISPSTEVKRPEAIELERHLHLSMADIVEVIEGQILPSESHVGDVIAFARLWDRQAPMLIHCYAGVSRSTAAAYVSACALAPEGSEGDIAQRLRKASPTATPNARIVALADDLLGRGGRMVEAIASIGRGADCMEGVAFELKLAS